VKRCERAETCRYAKEKNANTETEDVCLALPDVENNVIWEPCDVCPPKDDGENVFVSNFTSSEEATDCTSEGGPDEHVVVVCKRQKSMDCLENPNCDRYSWLPGCSWL